MSRSDRRRSPSAPLVLLLGLLLLCGTASAGVAGAQTPVGGLGVATKSVEDLRPGMRGVGYTVVRGVEPEEFEVEILGVLKNPMPKQDLVVARLSGLDLDRTGVAAGLSGSPVYIDGELIGAVAWRLGAFPTEAIAGITPIANMQRMTMLAAAGDSLVAAGSDRLPVLSAAASLLAGEEPEGLASLVSASTSLGITPIATPVAIGGIDPEVVGRLQPLFEALGWRVGVGGGSASQAANGPLKPGSAVAAQLMRGDITFTATGTVTHVDEGGRVLAFGHSFMQGGSVDFPMTGAEVLLVLDDLAGSQKITAAGDRVLGAIRQDLTPGILGVVGAEPKTIPVIMLVDSGLDTPDRFEFEMITHKLLSPTYLFVGLASGLQSIGTMFGDSTFEVRGDFHLEDDLGASTTSPDRAAISIRNVFSTPSQAYVPLSQMIMSVFAFLYDNEFRPIEVERIDLTIEARPDRKVAEISRVWADRVRVRPGESVDLTLYLKPYRAREVVEHVSVQIPEGTPPGPLTLLVADASAVSREEQSFIQGEFAPKDIQHLINLLNSIRVNDHVYIQASRPAEGAFLGGEPMPALPLSILKILSAERTSGAFLRLRKSVILEESKAVDYVVKGEHRVELDVLRR